MVRFLSIAALAMCASSASAQDYPSKPITVIVPFSAGGGTDTGARIAEPSMEAFLGGELVLKNVPGAGGTIGTTELANANPDGYTIGWMPIGPMASQPHLRKVSYTTDSFVPICRLTNDPMAVLVNPGSYGSLDEMVEAAKGGGELLTAGPPPGSMPHVAQLALAQAMDLNFKYVPHEGGSAMAKSLLGGKVNLSTEMASFTERFGLEALAVLGEERHPAFPDTPSLTELGGPTLNYSIWMGFFAPAGTPADVVEKLSAACQQTASHDEYLARAADAKRNIGFLNSGDFTEFYVSQFNQAGDLLESAGLKK